MNKSIYFCLSIICLSSFLVNNSFASDYTNQDDVIYINSEDEAMLRQYIEFEEKSAAKKPHFVQISTSDDDYIIDDNNSSSYVNNNLPDSPAAIRKYYQSRIQQCMDTYQEELEIARSVLSTGSHYSATADVTHIFAQINQCYENIGYQIIGHLYGGSKEEYSNFQKNAKTYYIKASDINFNPIHCEDICSLEALVNAQIQKFAEFRIYLTKLIEAKIERK